MDICGREISGLYGSTFNLLRNCPWPFAHTSLSLPYMSIPFQTDVRAHLHHDFFSCWFPVASDDSCVLDSPMNTSQLCLGKHDFCLFLSSFVSALFLLTLRTFVPLPAPNCSLSRMEMGTCSLCSKAPGTIFAFLLLGCSSNNWRLQK